MQSVLMRGFRIYSRVYLIFVVFMCQVSNNHQWLLNKNNEVNEQFVVCVRLSLQQAALHTKAKANIFRLSFDENLENHKQNENK